MEALPLKITSAGMAAIVSAEEGGLDAITIAEVGITNTPFDVETALALPDEIKRLAMVSGAAVDANTVHLTARDSSADEYEFSGFGIYLADGTLFGLYSQDEAILGKSPVSVPFLAFDFKLSSPIAELFTFGDANFLNPPATTQTRGVAKLASLEEVQAGVDSEKIVTPALLKAVYVALEMLGVANGVATLGADGKLALAQRPPIDPINFWFPESEAEMLDLAASVGDWAIRGDTDPTEIYVLQAEPASDLANWLSLNIPAPVSSVNGKVGAVVLNAADLDAVPKTRQVKGGGLVSGGGALDEDRTLTVAIASAAEALAAEINNKALTPASLAGVLMAIAARVPASRTISGGGLVSGGGALDEDRTLTVAIASAAEALAAEISNKAVVPASLTSILASIAAKVDSGRKINTSGLASGGGTLGADRTITVPAASVAEVAAMSSSTKAVTPASLVNLINSILAQIPNFSISYTSSTLVVRIGGAIFQVFSGSVAGNANTATLYYPETFPNTCFGAWINGGLPNTEAQENSPYVTNRTASYISVLNAIGTTTAVQVLAIGR
ncbi:MAG: hypothetical protein BGO57_13175 [Sphingomonadales bacterium 63-6]|nr:MAG: hypothetical protein BGO57_13175 [Sphingomonadales bacterium 63-6]